MLAETGALLARWRALRAELEGLPATGTVGTERAVYRAILAALDAGLLRGLDAALATL